MLCDNGMLKLFICSAPWLVTRIRGAPCVQVSRCVGCVRKFSLQGSLQLEQAGTHKSAKTHAGTVVVPRDT